MSTAEDQFSTFVNNDEPAPVMPVAIAHLTVPEDPRMNDVLKFSWEVMNAASVRLKLSGSIQADLSVAAEDFRTYVAHIPGPVFIELTALGAPDRYGNCSSVSRMCHVIIRAPPLRLMAYPRELRGIPGTWVRLHWGAENAARVLIERPMFDENMDANPCHAIDILVDAIEDLVRITACSHDGESTETFICRIRPTLDEVSDIDDDLKWFNQS